MTVFDYVVLAIAGISVLLSVIRGLVREVLALAGWVVAFVAASLFAEDAAALVSRDVPGEALPLLVGFAAVFIAALVVMSLLAMVASKLVKSAGLGVEDRVLGGVFGLARGVLVVMVLVLAAGLTALPRQPAWRNAVLSGPLEIVAGQIKAWLPAGLSKRITYD
ncbi:MAG: CvpA family protein [Betaproteobacteria bacterium]|nr:CvpA family protein [Betaproteobacteria bacterium]MBI2508551.1 CvpA family protein [Betaproteobacteria bacterium]